MAAEARGPIHDADHFDNLINTVQIAIEVMRERREEAKARCYVWVV